ncbi:hypothetical protein [Cryptosporangium aurantiacum]|uniref:hypothetical protein n=1 Tax=Cryptosporangium aurantiacum TaxID=134849 RepID=UPI001160F21C|nr:hypothetical protein [Cryptosporangium aurantiacum]
MTEAEWEYLADGNEDFDREFESDGEFEGEFDDEFEEDLEDEIDEFENETDEDAERVSAALGTRPTAQEDEYQTSRRSRWTPCFTPDEVAKTVRLYEENDTAGAADPSDVRVDRASCIVMLNVGLGRLLALPTVDHPARTYQPDRMPRRPRMVRMGALSTHTVDSALNQLVRQGRATGPLRFNFVDSRGGRAGTRAPVALRGSVRAAVIRRSPTRGCWYAFGLSLVNATHSVLLLVDFTGPSRRIFWLDQNRRGLNLDVTSNLDDVITTFTKDLWRQKQEKKGIGVKTSIRLWRLRKPA